MYENQREWKSLRGVSSIEASEIFVGYAETLGLDTVKYKEDAASEEVKELINKDLMQAMELGVQGTPTIFIVKNYGEDDESIEKIQNSGNFDAELIVADIKLAAGIEE